MSRLEDYYNSDVQAYIWPDNKQSKCAYCGELTFWNIIPWLCPNLGAITCCSVKCLDGYKAEMVLSMTRNDDAE